MLLKKRLIEDFWSHSLILSIGLHGVLLILITFLNLYYPQMLLKALANTVKEKSNEEISIVIELDKEKEEDKVVDLSNPLVGLQNLMAQGRLTKEKGVHLPGAPETATVVSIESPKVPPTEQDEKKGKNKFKPEDVGEQKIPEKELQEKVESQEMTKSLDSLTRAQRQVLTEESVNFRFNMNSNSAIPRLGSRRAKYAEFFIYFFKSIRKDFLSSRTLPLYQKDKVGMVISVSRTGELQFESWRNKSKKQNGINDIAQKTIDYSTSIPKVPLEFFNVGENKAYLPFELVWSGPPIYMWSIRVDVPAHLEEGMIP